MSQTIQSSIQRQLNNNSLIKLLTNSQKSLLNTDRLIVERNGAVIFEAEVGGIAFESSSGQIITVDSQELREAISNEETEITVTEEGGIRIKLKERQIWMGVRKDSEAKRVRKEDTEIEGRVSKLEEQVRAQALALQETQHSYKSMVSQLVEEIMKLKTQLGSAEQEVSAAKLAIFSTQSELRSLSCSLQPVLAQEEEFRCFHHPFNPHSHHFTLRLTPHCLHIQKTTDNAFHNFISNLPIPPAALTAFRIKQVKVVDGEVYLGVGTRSVFGDITSWNRDFLSYYSGDGDVCENGLFHEGGDRISDGETVSLQVDLQQQRVSWWLEEKLLAQAALPPQMQGRRLYLVLLMKHRGDQLDLLL